MKSKKERFKVVAANRVQRVIDSLDSLSKCSNRSNYEYTEEDVKKMISILKKKIKYLEESFAVKNEKKRNVFKF